MGGIDLGGNWWGGRGSKLLVGGRAKFCMDFVFFCGECNVVYSVVEFLSRTMVLMISRAVECEGFQSTTRFRSHFEILNRNN